MRISDLLLGSVEKYPEKTAIQYLDKGLTYRELYENCCRTANALQKAGVKPGEVVCIVCRNSIEYIEIEFAVSLLGAVPALVNWKVAPSGILNSIRQTGAKAVFVSNSEQRTISYLQANAGDSLRLVLTPYDPLLPSDYAAFRDGEEASFPTYEADPEELGLILFTSGTTGAAKGVMVSHRAVVQQAISCMESGSWTDEDVYLCLSPLFHSIGLTVMTLIMVGGKLVLCPSDITRRLSSIYTIATAEKITRTVLVPTLLQRLVTYMEDHGLTSDTLHFIHYGASPMSKELLERSFRVFDCKFQQGYGMSETYGTCIVLKAEDHHHEELLNSVGKPMPGVSVRIVDEQGNELPAGEIGEISIRTPTVMIGYLNLPEKTASVLRGGWYYSGDMGYLDENGYLFLTGRKDDMIITGGENVYPQEVEACLLSMTDDVDAVCVVGIPDKNWGEAIAAAIVKKHGSDLDDERALKYCADHLGRYKRPKHILFLDSLPTTSVGKISHPDVKKLFMKALGRE